MDEQTQRRIAANEARLREMNEQNVEASDSFQGRGDTLEIMCECAYEDCEEMLSVPAETYAATRAVARRFIVAAGHAIPDVEVVVGDHGPYLVVEKVEAGAEVAEERA